jgi:hypothetical protein
LEKAGVEWPAATQLDLVRYEAKDAWTVVETGDEDAKKAATKTLMSVYKLWRPSDLKLRFASEKPMLSILEVDDAAVATFFTLEVIDEHFTAWLLKGSAMEDAIIAFARMAETEWELPEEDVLIETVCAQLLIDTKRCLAILPCLLDNVVSVSTNQTIFEDIIEMDKVSSVLSNNSVLAKFGRALKKSPHWHCKFAHTAKNATNLAQFVPGLTKALVDVGRLDLEPSAVTAQTLQELADKVPYYHVQMGKGSADELESKVAAAVVASTRKLLDKGLPKSDEAPGTDDRSKLLTRYADLVKVVIAACPAVEELLRVKQQIQISMSALSAGQKAASFIDAFDQYDKDHTTVESLRRSIKAYDTKQVDARICERAYTTVVAILEADVCPLASDAASSHSSKAQTSLLKELVPFLPGHAKDKGRNLETVLSNSADCHMLMAQLTDLGETPAHIAAANGMPPVLQKLRKSIATVMSFKSNAFRPIEPFHDAHAKCLLSIENIRLQIDNIKKAHTKIIADKTLATTHELQTLFAKDEKLTLWLAQTVEAIDVVDMLEKFKDTLLHVPTNDWHVAAVGLTKDCFYYVI